MITLAMFERCLWRLADIRSGRVKKPARKEGGVVGLVGARTGLADREADNPLVR